MRVSGTNEVRVRPADWEADGEALRSVRFAVFVEEQGVDPALELDAWDETSFHVLAECGGRVVGTGRLLPDGHVGRLAVEHAWRGRGVGRALMEALLAAAGERDLPNVILHSQVSAIPFYEKLGFEAEGAEFVEAGIPHRLMTRELSGK